MKFRVHFTWPNGDQDSFDVEGEDIQEVQDKVTYFFEVRALDRSNAWSEEI